MKKQETRRTAKTRTKTRPVEQAELKKVSGGSFVGSVFGF